MSFWDDVKSNFDFEKFQIEDWWEQIKEDPERIFIGAMDPFSSEMWGGITGKDYEPMINQWGGPTEERFGRAQAEGIDTGPAEGAHEFAQSVAQSYALNYGAGQGASFGEGQGWYDSSVTPWVEKGLSSMGEAAIDPPPPAYDDPDFGPGEDVKKKEQKALPTFGVPDATKQAPLDPDVPGQVRIIHDPYGQVVPPDPNVVPTFGRV